MDFLDKLSRVLLASPEARSYVDVASFAFWCRRAGLVQMKSSYPDLDGRLGRGVAFHIAPSNVAVNFAYSMAAGLLTGNANVVRVPSVDFPQVRVIRDAVASALAARPDMTPYVCLLRYGHERAVNDALSAMCDTRVIWGGDRTIDEIRASRIGPRAMDVTFADRYSICLIDASRYLEMSDKARIAADFYNDTLLTDQNACTSPKLVAWMGDGIEDARGLFWGAFEARSSGYALQPISAVERLVKFCRLCADRGGARRVSWAGDIAFKVELDSLDDRVVDYFGNCGYFLEYRADCIDDLYPICGEGCQTMVVLGVDADVIDDFLLRRRPKGLDRIAPMGRAMDFSLRWDGYDLPYVMTRRRSVARSPRGGNIF
jgi:hypothetical protein